MRVLVTGHQGYLGAVMVGVFQQAGHEVVGLDTGYFDGCDFIAPPPAPDKIIRKDVRDVQAGDLAGIDAIAHLSALSNDPMGALKSDWTLDINYRASVRLAEIARQAGVQRFLFSSSCSIYGAAGDEMLTEQAQFNPITDYARSKVLTEQALTSLASDEFSPVYMRNATAYGVSPRLRADLVVNNLTAWAFTTGKVKIMSDGTPWRPIVHAEDIARAFAEVLDAPRELIHDQAFNVGADGENYRVRDLAEIVRQTVPGCQVEYAGSGNPDSRNYRVNFGKFAAAFPSWKPKWNARTGATQLYNAYRHAGLTFEQFDGKTYIRLKQLQHLISTNRLDDTLRWR